jgi:hypothetical protein
VQDSEWECILTGDFNREWPQADSTSPPSDFQKAAGDLGLSNPTADALRALGDPNISCNIIKWSEDDYNLLLLCHSCSFKINYPISYLLLYTRSGSEIYKNPTRCKVIQTIIISCFLYLFDDLKYYVTGNDLYL